MFCYSKGPAGDYGFRLVNANYVPQAGEAVFPTPPTEDQLTAAFPDYPTAAQSESIKAQITSLEKSITPRMVREALAGSTATFPDGQHAGKTAAQAIAAIDAAVVSLRSQIS